MGNFEKPWKVLKALGGGGQNYVGEKHSLKVTMWASKLALQV